MSAEATKKATPATSETMDEVFHEAMRRWISVRIALSPSVFLMAQLITSRPGRNDPRVPSTKL